MFKKKSKFSEEELIQERNSISLEEEQKELEEAETVVEDLEKEAAKLKEIEKEIQKTIKEAKASEKKRKFAICWRGQRRNFRRCQKEKWRTY